MKKLNFWKGVVVIAICLCLVIMFYAAIMNFAKAIGLFGPSTFAANVIRVTFTSLGRDNKPGRTGEDPDMIGSFDGRRENGR